MVLDDTMTRVQETVSYVQSGVLRPVREVYGVLAGIRTALCSSRPRRATDGRSRHVRRRDVYLSRDFRLNASFRNSYPSGAANAPDRESRERVLTASTDSPICSDGIARSSRERCSH